MASGQLNSAHRDSRQRLRLSRALTALAIGTGSVVIVVSPAVAQGQTVPSHALAGHKLPPITPIAAPPYSNEIPLYPDKQTTRAGEQWETYLGGITVRNVTVPTLIPFLPDPAKATGTAIVMAPGGAFRYLGIDDSEARRLAANGVAVFILKYRTVPTDRDPQAYLMNLFKFLGDAIKTNQQSASSAPKASDVTAEAFEDGEGGGPPCESAR